MNKPIKIYKNIAKQYLISMRLISINSSCMTFVLYLISRFIAQKYNNFFHCVKKHQTALQVSNLLFLFQFFYQQVPVLSCLSQQSIV